MLGKLRDWISLSAILLLVMTTIWHVWVLLDNFRIRVITIILAIWGHSFWLKSLNISGHLSRIHWGLKWSCWNSKTIIIFIFFHVDKRFIIDLIKYFNMDSTILIATDSCVCFLHNFLLFHNVFFYMLRILMIHLNFIHFR